MVKKYSITVSDELAERIEKWRSKIKLSEIFQNAISDVISRKEFLSENVLKDIDVDALVERLKESRHKDAKDLYETGYDMGAKHFTRFASYPDMVKASQFVVPGKFDELEDMAVDCSFSKEILRWIEDVGYYGYEPQKGNYIAGPLVEHIRGWHNGFMDVWCLIKDKV